VTSDPDRLLGIAMSVCDDTPVDWDAAERLAETLAEREVIRRMRLAARIARFRAGDVDTDAGGDVEPAGGALDATLPIRTERSAAGEEAARRAAQPAGHATPAPAEAPMPAQWGDLKILRRAGRGAFADVFIAWDPRLEREVALKLIHDDAIGEAEKELGPGDADRMVREGRLLARIRHPNVAVVYGADRFDGRPGIWMESIRGVTLEALLAERGPLGADEAARVGRGVCRALAAVHAEGLLHRDVKARNVMREEGGRVVLMDFGLGLEREAAGQAEAGSLSGTPLYLAPELFEGATPSPRSDLYAVGVLLFRLVTGRYPVEAATLAALRDAHASGRATPLRALRADLPGAFVAAVERLLARDAAARYASAAEAERALERAAGAGAADAPDARRAPHRRARAALLVGIALAGIAALLAARGALPVGAGAPYTVEAALYRWTEQGAERLVSGARVAPGDELYMEVRGSRPLYTYVVNEDDRGDAFLLFPLPGHETTNPLPARRSARLPGQGAGGEVHWRVTSAGGRERFLVVASPRPIAEIETEIASLPAADLERPLGAAPLPPQTMHRLRGVGGLAERTTARSAEAPVRRLSELAAALREGAETIRGVWVRQIELENPSP
jgi:hypothetical protein